MAYIEKTKILGNQTSYAPFYGSPESVEELQMSVDEGGSLVTRATTLTDEGTYRINFANTSLSVSIGTITSIVGKVITGTGFNNVDVHLKDYFKLDADPESAWKQIASIDSNTQITLYENYIGGASGTGSRSLIQPLTGAGASITVLNGQGIITAGTTPGSVTFLNRSVDYSPLVFRTRLSISQRIVNQNIRIGFAEANATPKWFARFRCDGAVSTVNTTIICESGRNPTTAPSAAETETTNVIIPNGSNTSQFLDYRVEHLVESIRFYINNILVAEHSKSLPSPYDYMASGVRVENVGTPASSTIITVDYITTKNHNKLEVGVMSSNENIVTTQPLLVPFTFTQTGVIPINTDLMVIDCSQLRSLSIQCTSIGTAGVITGQWSNDQTLVSRQNGQLFDPIGGGISGTFNTTALRITNVIARYFILRLTTATTAGTTTLLVNGLQSTIPTYVNTQTVSGTLTVGSSQSGHSAAASGSPFRTGAKVQSTTIATQDNTLVAGDTADSLASTSGQTIIKSYGTAELDFYLNANFNLGSATAATPLTLIGSPGNASVRNYITGLTIQTDAVGTAGTVAILDYIVAGTSVTIANPGVFTTGTHFFSVGDAIAFSNIGTITGITANTVYYITSTNLSATTFTIALTTGGTPLQITGVSSAFTVYKVLYQLRLQTVGISSPTIVTFSNPLRAAANQPTLFMNPNLTSGNIYLTVNGYRGF